MPWTFSHPAVVFPIKQSRIGKFLNLPALIIGSMSPDLFYSVGLYSLSTTAHHFTGWFYTAFPLCIIIFILFSMFSSSLNKVLPIPIEAYHKWNFKDCFIIVLSLFIAAATHIIWDGFTHETGNFIRNISFLQYNMFNSMTNGQEIRIYKLLQYLGSFFGLLYLVTKYWQYHYMLSSAQQLINQQKLYKLFGIAVISIGVVFLFAVQLSYTKTGFHLNSFIFNQLRLTEFVFVILVLIYALWINRYKPIKR